MFGQDDLGDSVMPCQAVEHLRVRLLCTQLSVAWPSKLSRLTSKLFSL